jgi:hypothetical protein
VGREGLNWGMLIKLVIDLAGNAVHTKYWAGYNKLLKQGARYGY